MNKDLIKYTWNKLPVEAQYITVIGTGAFLYFSFFILLSIFIDYDFDTIPLIIMGVFPLIGVSMGVLYLVKHYLDCKKNYDE